METVEDLAGQAELEEIIPEPITLEENVAGSAPAITAQVDDELPEWLTEVPFEIQSPLLRDESPEPRGVGPTHHVANVTPFEQLRAGEPSVTQAPSPEASAPISEASEVPFAEQAISISAPNGPGELQVVREQTPAESEASSWPLVEQALPPGQEIANVSLEQPSAEISTSEQPSIEQPRVEFSGHEQLSMEPPSGQAEARSNKDLTAERQHIEQPVALQDTAEVPAPVAVQPPAVEAEMPQQYIAERVDQETQRVIMAPKITAATAEESSPEPTFAKTPPEEQPHAPVSTAEPAAPVEEELPDWLREIAERVEPLAEAEASSSGELAEKEIVELETTVPASGLVQETTVPAAAPELEQETNAPLAELAQGPAAAHAPEEATAAGASLVSPEIQHAAVQMRASSAVEEPAGQPPAAEAPTAPTTPDNLASQLPPLEPDKAEPQVQAASTHEAGAAAAPAIVSEESVGDKQAEQPGAAQVAPSEFPDWMRELTPPPDFPPPEGSKPLRAEPPQLGEDERDELPDWLRQPLAIEGLPEGAAPVVESEPRAFDFPSDATTPVQIPAYPPEGKHPEEPPEEVAETEGLLVGVRGVLPLAMTPSQPRAVAPPSARQSDGALVFESVLAAAAAGSVAAAPAPSRAARRSWSKWWIYLAVVSAALIPLFIPPNLAGLGFSVGNNSPTAAFYDKIQSLASGSTVLVAFDYDTGQAVEMNPGARAVVQDLARRRINVVALSTLPTGVQIAQTVLDQASRQEPGWNSGEKYVNVGYIPGGEAGLRSLADNWLPAQEQTTLASAPFSQKVSGLQDFSLAIEFAGSGESLRAWMEQVQPRRQVTFVAVVSAAVESQARNYLGANQLAAFLRGLGGAAEYELFSNQAGLSVRTVDAQSFSHLALFAVIVVGNLVFLVGRLKRPKISKP